MKPVRVVLVERDKDVRVGIRRLLDRIQAAQCLAAVSDGPKALQAVRAYRPDVILVGGSLSSPQGSKWLKRAAEELPRLRVVWLSSAISDFMRKTADLGSLTGRGSPPRTKPIDRQAIRTPLTVRQQQVLQLIAEGYSTKQIAHTLGISTKTVESHRGLLMERLDIRSIAGLVRYAIRTGLVDVHDCSSPLGCRPASRAA